MEDRKRRQEFRSSHARLKEEYPPDPKVVYLASCYRSARGEYGVSEHIHAAEVTARSMWKLGLAVICPCKNSAFFGGSDIPDQVWLFGDFAMLKRCDAIVMHENWEASTGARLELDEASEAGIRAFFLDGDWRKLAAWAKKPKDILLRGNVRTSPDKYAERQETKETAGEKYA